MRLRRVLVSSQGKDTMTTRNFSKHLAGQIGESLVVAELGRRGIVATAFSGNVPDIDLLAFKNNKTIHLQVKAWRMGAVSFNATRFLKIRFDGTQQVVEGFVDELDLNLIYVFVNIGNASGTDRFFILSQGELAKQVRGGYESFLSKHDGVRPRNHLTTHNAVSIEQLELYEDNWGLIQSYFD